MKFYLILICSFFLFITIPASAQSNIYIPLNIQEAYTKQTRSTDGTPGEKYWQNSSNYRIRVNVDPGKKMVTGSEEIEYFNNSPDTLDEIVIRLYQNIYKPGASRDFPLKEEDLTNGTEIRRFNFNGIEVPVEENPRMTFEGTNLIYKPEEAILPASKTLMEFEWSFAVSTRHLRMGVYDSSSFFIAYWYPQVSVYDDIDGWDKNEYTGQQEFYNDFNNYEVEVTLPNSFAVWATGTLENPEDVFTDEYLKKYRDAHNSEEVIKIVSPDDLGKKIYSSSNSTNTWKFKAENVSDFSFALSDHYLWDALSITRGSNSSEKVFISAVYKKESADFYHVALISEKSVKYFSEVLPGVPFPFPSLTIFNGGSTGGMEFPMMVNDASFISMFNTVGTTSHEIAHQYFPFYVGTNERKYAFMDEGMAVMLPFEFQENEIEGNFPKARNAYQYELLAGKEIEMPPVTPSVLLNRVNYRTAVYHRPGLGYYFLRDAIGPQLFDKALREYMTSWQGKHPVPFDFFNSFNRSIGKDLSWYWIPWFFEKGYPDLAIDNVEIDENKLKIVIKNKGMIPVPVEMIILEVNEETSSRIGSRKIYETAAVWESGKDEYVIEYEVSKLPQHIILTLGAPDIPDIDRMNNQFVFKATAQP